MQPPTPPPEVERITDGELTLALIVRAEYRPAVTTFVTAPEYEQQVGLVVYPAQSEVPRHEHRPIERSVRCKSECLVVRHGRSELTIYSDSRKEICRTIVSTGDVVLLVAGGHGFRQLEDTVFLEIKQGPYAGVDEKLLF